MLILLSGCTYSKIYSSGNEPVYLNAPETKYEMIKHFKEEESICLDYSGAYDISPVMRKILDENKGDAIINANWKIKESAKNIAVNIATLGIANCRTVVVEGDVIKFVKEEK